MEWAVLRKRRLALKLLLTVGTASLAASLLFLAVNTTTSKYEITVYDSYPFLFWALLLVAIFFGQIAIFEGAQADETGRYWQWGFGLVLAATLVVLLIPFYRYNLYARGDMLTLIGMIEEIRNLGFVPESNYYPNVHLLMLTFASVTGLSVPKAINLVTPIMTVFYVLSLYSLLNVLFTKESKVLFVLPLVALPLFTQQHVVFQPSWFAFLTVPFVFYLIFRSYDRQSRFQFKFLLLLAIVSLVFYHPAVTLFFTLMLGLLKAAFVVGRLYTKRSRKIGNTPLIAASLAFILFFSWYYSFEGIIASTLSVFYVLFGLSAGSSQFGNLAASAARTSPEILDIVLVGVHTYGMSAAIVSMSLLFFGYYAYLTVWGDREYDAVETFLGATLLVFTFGAAVAFFVDIVLRFHRILRFAIFAGPLLIGLGLYTLSTRLDPKTASQYLRPVVYTSFFVFAFLGVFTLYGSPLSDDSNLQITQAEIEGMEWLFENRNTSLVIDELGINQYRLYTYTQSKKGLGTNIRWRLPPPPMHFAYANASLEDLPYRAAEHRRYLVVTRLGREKNPRFYPKYRQYWRHNPSDFRRLERDSEFLHVYDDGTLDAYVVRGVGVQTNESR